MVTFIQKQKEVLNQYQIHSWDLVLDFAEYRLQSLLSSHEGDHTSCVLTSVWFQTHYRIRPKLLQYFLKFWFIINYYSEYLPFLYISSQNKFCMNETPVKKADLPQKLTPKMVDELKSRRTNTLGTHWGAALGLFWVHSSPRKRRGWWTLRLDPHHLRHVPCRLKYSKLIQWGFDP